MFNVLKSLVSFAAGMGAGAVVGNAIKATTPADLSKIQKILVGVGTFAIGGAVAEAASNSVVRQMDEVAEVFNGVEKTEE